MLFTGAIEIINTLAAAQASGGLKRALHNYTKPSVMCIPGEDGDMFPVLS